MILAAHATALVGVWFDRQEHSPDFQSWPMDSDHPLLRRTAKQLEQYFDGERRRFDIPLDLSGGTPFQQRVWHNLLAIEAGTTSTYAAISRAIGQPNAVRAVGGAIGRNPFSIIVPCHRVIGSNGTLTGYTGGLDRKVALLQLESTI
jgi:methylated-DNA-[protein]-cysteine S-methyltransferase